MKCPQTGVADGVRESPCAPSQGHRLDRDHRRVTTIGTAVSLLLTLTIGISMMVTPWWKHVTRNTYIAYFPNTNGVYTGDEIRILGVAVGTIDKIEPQPNAAKVTFSVESQYSLPADVKAAVLSRHWSRRERSNSSRSTPAARNWLTARPFRRSEPRSRSNGTTCVSNWRS